MNLGQGMDHLIATKWIRHSVLYKSATSLAFGNGHAIYISLSAFALAALLVSPVNGQSGSRDPIPPVAPKERAPDISVSANNVNRSQANVISNVVFRGNRIIPEHELSRNIGTRPGRYFDPDQLQQDVDKLWRLAKIKKINGPYIDRSPQGIVVTFDIVERRHIQSTDFIGNRGLTDRALKKESELDVNQPLDLHKIRMAKTRIEDLYKEKGFSKTQVEIIDVEEVENGNVKFLIHEDNRQRVWKVEFVGNTFATDARLKNFVNSKPGVLKIFGGVAQQQQIEQDILRLESYYKSFGYFNARIGREIDEGSNGRWLTIRYIIDEGPRYKIRNVSFIGNQSFSSDQLNNLVELKPAEGAMPEFNVAKMNQDVVSLRDLYGSQGFVYSNVEAEPRFLEEPGMLDIVYRVDEGKQYYVGNINVHIEGDVNVTKREVVLNRLSLKPGDLINAQEMRQSERRLGSAQIFAGRDAGPGQSPPRIVVRPPELEGLDSSPGPGGSGSRTRSASQSSGSSSRHR